MDETEVLTNLYQEARKILPRFTRRLKWEDIDNARNFFPEDLEIKDYELQHIRIGDLEKQGFSSKTPGLEEFIRKYGLEKEMAIFVKKFAEQILERQEIDYEERIKDAREQGIKDTMQQYRLNEESHGWVYIGTPDD